MHEKIFLEFKARLIELLGKDFPLNKDDEMLVDPKSVLKSDLKSLKTIFEENSLKTVEIQHLVCLKLRDVNGRFKKIREDSLVQYQKLTLTSELTSEKLDAITTKVQDFADSRFESESYSDYLIPLFSGISGQEESTETNKQEAESHEQEYKKFKEFLDSKEIESMKQTLDLRKNIKITLKTKRHRVFDYQGNMIRKYYDKPSIHYTVRKSEEQAVQLFLNKVFEQIPETNFKVVPKILDTIKVEVGTSCGLCSSELGLPQYYNYFQKQHLCLPCGDKRDLSIKTIKQFTVSDNLIFINSPNPLEIDLYKLGKNTKPSEEKEIEFCFYYGCQGCRRKDDSRYICLDCKLRSFKKDGLIDFCKTCFQKMALDKNQELINALQLENHQIDHSFLMIRTPEGEYYNY